MSHFLCLPREVRDLIYEYCLVVEGILDPCTPYYEEKNPKNANRKPETALLRVNRRIGDEAAQILYGKNVWRISYKEDDASWPELEWAFPLVHRAWTKKNIIRYMRHIVLEFDSRDVDHQSISDISCAWFTGQPVASPGLGWVPGLEGAEAIHAGRRGMLSKAWIWKRKIVDEMHLDSAVLDFTNCFCVSGCCRLFEWVFGAHERTFGCRYHYWPGCGVSRLERAEVFGLLNERELAQVRAMGWVGDHPTEKKRAWFIKSTEYDSE